MTASALVLADAALERGEVPTVPHAGSPVHVATKRGSRLLAFREHMRGLWPVAYHGLSERKGWRSHELDGRWDDNAPPDWLWRPQDGLP